MKLPSLVFRRIRGDAIETFKYMQQLQHKYSKDSNQLLPRWRSTVNTRGQELRLQKRYCKSELRPNFFGNRTVNLWNSLPNRVVTSSSLGRFKGRFDQLFGDSCYMTNYEDILSSLSGRDEE